MSTLTLEVRGQEDRTVRLGGGGTEIMLTPRLGEDYWQYRVRLSETQAIVGFPKFSTIGIGFAQEEDWNTNLPYTCGTDEIWQHISHNKGDDALSDEDCIAAIGLIQEAARTDRDAPGGAS